MEANLAHMFSDEHEAAALGTLDPFMIQGDEQTWELEDWNWDPYNLFAAPKDVPQVHCCQALKRRKAVDGTVISAPTLQQAAACHPQTVNGQVCQPHGYHGINSNNGCCISAPNRQLQQQQQQQAMAASLLQQQQQQALYNAALQAGPWAAQGYMQQLHANLAAQQGFATQPPSAQASHIGWGAQLAASNPSPSGAASAACQAPNTLQHLAAALSQPTPALQPRVSSPNMSSAETSASLPNKGDASVHVHNSNTAPATTRGHGRREESVEQASSKPTKPVRQAAQQKRQQAAAAAAAAEAEVDSDGELHMDSDDEDLERSDNHHINLDNVVSVHDMDDGKMVCQVPGCGKDLTNLKEYHQRYRICEVHIKLPQVMKDGRLQRFCQQCGRFHDLSAFDGNRKSCRDQLSKHNARRRRRAQIEQQKAKQAEQVGTLTGDDKSDVGRLMASLMTSPHHLHALRLLLGIQTHPALPPMQPYNPDTAQGDAAGAKQGDEPMSYGMARDIIASRNEFAPSYESDQKVLRISMKLFNKTPADLPADLKDQVVSWLANAPVAVEGTIRPGCVFLNLRMLVDKPTYAAAQEAGLASLVKHLLTATNCNFWWKGSYMIQVFDDIQMVTDGAVVAAHKNARLSSEYPTLARVSPVCVVGDRANTITLNGQNLTVSGNELLVRWNGRFARPKMTPSSASKSGRVATATVGPYSGCGLLNVEVSHGAYLTTAKGVLVVDDEQVAAEVCQLEAMKTTFSTEAVDTILNDLGLVFQAVQGYVFPPQMHQAVLEKARRLLALSCDLGWAGVASRILPLLSHQTTEPAKLVSAIHASTARKDKLSLLHRAVRSASLPLLQGMLHWGKTHGYRWRSDLDGPNGITPLHLSALLDDARIALVLLDHCPAQAFTQLVTRDGVSPFHLAFQMGHYSLDHLLQSLGTSGCCVKQEEGNCGTVSRSNSTRPSSAHIDALAQAEKGLSHALQEVDPCEVCQSTVPPLLLSIMAKCVDCGGRRSCLAEDGHEAGLCAGCQELKLDEAVRALAAAAKDKDKEMPGDFCGHHHGTRYSITALCQSCHANRVLEVA